MAVFRHPFRAVRFCKVAFLLSGAMWLFSIFSLADIQSNRICASTHSGALHVCFSFRADYDLKFEDRNDANFAFFHLRIGTADIVGEGASWTCHDGTDRINADDRAYMKFASVMAIQSLDFLRLDRLGFELPRAEMVQHSGIFLTVPMPWFVLLSGIGCMIFRRRIPRDVSIACQRCGYDLTGNESGVCPECGTPISGAPNRVVGPPLDQPTNGITAFQRALSPPAPTELRPPARG